MSEPLRPCVLIALRRGDRWLQIRRAAGIAGAGAVAFPTGTVEPGESLEEAVVREAHEELGVTVRSATPFADGRFPEWAEHIYGFEIEVEDGPITPEPAEVGEVLWLTTLQLMEHPDRLGRLAAVFGPRLP